jgi:hypothetical protein
MAPRQHMRLVNVERPWRTCNNPILSRDEATGADRDIGEFEGLDNRLRNVRPDVDVACLRQWTDRIATLQAIRTTVQCRENPWLGRVKVFGCV